MIFIRTRGAASWRARHRGPNLPPDAASGPRLASFNASGYHRPIPQNLRHDTRENTDDANRIRGTTPALPRWTWSAGVLQACTPGAGSCGSRAGARPRVALAPRHSALSRSPTSGLCTGTTSRGAGIVRARSPSGLAGRTGGRRSQRFSWRSVRRSTPVTCRGRRRPHQSRRDRAAVRTANQQSDLYCLGAGAGCCAVATAQALALRHVTRRPAAWLMSRWTRAAEQQISENFGPAVAT